MEVDGKLVKVFGCQKRCGFETWNINLNRETIFAALTRVVEKHLPMSKREAPAGFEFRTLSELWASKLISADVNDTDTFQVSNDIEKLREVASLVRQLRSLSTSLTPPTIRSIRRASPFFWADNSDVVVDALIRLELLERAVAKVRKDDKFQKLVSKKRNWRAAAVAKECRRVWAKEHVQARMREAGEELPLNALSELSLSGERREIAMNQRLTYEKRVADFPPSTVHNDRPGPFGEFVQDVFVALGITNNEGEAVRAASALRALKQIESMTK